MDLEGFLTTRQAADVLGVDVATVYYYARDYPDFPVPQRFGRTLLWRERLLRDWRAVHPLKPRHRPAPG
jgi:predicted DNA-binding transcriptional regulator AlpA